MRSFQDWKLDSSFYSPRGLWPYLKLEHVPKYWVLLKLLPQKKKNVGCDKDED